MREGDAEEEDSCVSLSAGKRDFSEESVLPQFNIFVVRQRNKRKTRQRVLLFTLRNKVLHSGAATVHVSYNS